MYYNSKTYVILVKPLHMTRKITVCERNVQVL